MSVSQALATPVDEITESSALAPRINGFHLEPRCRVCRNDVLRKKVNDMLATGASYAMIVRALAADNAELDKCDRMIHRRSLWLTPDELLDLTSKSYDVWNRHTNGPGQKLTWRKSVPPHPEGYDIAYEADYNGRIFRAIRSRTLSTVWRLECDNPATGEREGGLSREESLLACKKRVEREIAEGGWFAQGG